MDISNLGYARTRTFTGVFLTLFQLQYMRSCLIKQIQNTFLLLNQIFLESWTLLTRLETAWTEGKPLEAGGHILATSSSRIVLGYTDPSDAFPALYYITRSLGAHWDDDDIYDDDKYVSW